MRAVCLQSISSTQVKLFFFWTTCLFTSILFVLFLNNYTSQTNCFQTLGVRKMSIYSFFSLLFFHSKHKQGFPINRSHYVASRLMTSSQTELSLQSRPWRALWTPNVFYARLALKYPCHLSLTPAFKAVFPDFLNT